MSFAKLCPITFDHGVLAQSKKIINHHTQIANLVFLWSSLFRAMTIQRAWIHPLKPLPLFSKLLMLWYFQGMSDTLCTPQFLIFLSLYDSQNFKRSRRAFNLQQTFPPALSSIWQVKEVPRQMQNTEQSSVERGRPVDTIYPSHRLCYPRNAIHSCSLSKKIQTLLLLQQLWSYYTSFPIMLEAETSTSAKHQENYIPPAVPIPLEMHAFTVAYNHMLDAMRDVEQVARHALEA
ncbi:hypothetical protein F5J12DRAFT_784520 [Pisolithus orientalis]|uniref:uncharacterized protein n=1 Tax=Pisolithus orientalis TaxID=936130 RepID=UPI0022244E52|nr:uncharacterized protein F5J12DRAFT_784520 [Pisolithus orientalis]KAI6000218.1 hypothetical protein F5J12DRAFT_784520 [Pisolithus orientalis]